MKSIQLGDVTVTTLDDFAEAIHVNPSTAWRWSRKRRNALPTVRIGRRIYVLIDDLSAWVRRSSVSIQQKVKP
jgi:hypothetical protein